MPKISGRRIPSDDCLLAYDGEFVAIHEGEWVEVIPIRTYGELHSLQRFDRLRVELDAAEGEPDERERIGAAMDDAFNDLCSYLAPRVIRWNWTNAAGVPILAWNERDIDPETGEDRGPCARLPDDPEARVKAIERLETSELYYLLYAHKLDTPTDRKNGSSGLATTSSATPSPETSPETTEPSRATTDPSPTPPKSLRSARRSDATPQ